MVMTKSSCARGWFALPSVMASAALILLTPEIAAAEQIERPKFRSGLWRFERTVEYVRRPPNVNLVLTQSNTTRCVDPNVAMVGVFASPNVGNCRSEKPQRFGSQYIFSNRCDFMGPVSTVITAESDVSYVEINTLATEPLPKRDTVVAHRIGECSGANPQMFAEGSSVNIARRR
jgi:hypothetical protein